MTPYIWERFEYRCPENHRNEFDFAYAADEGDPLSREPKRPRLPKALPCPGCNYRLVTAALVSVLRCNYSENDFNMFIDDKYVESAAYHEAAHAVIAAVEQIPLKANGIRIDQRGNGFSHYTTVKPSGATNVGSDPLRESAIRSTQAGYAAQEKFYLRYFPKLPNAGSSHDADYVKALLDEMYPNTTDFFAAKDKLYKETQKLVDEHWNAIEALARTLWAKEWKGQAPPSGERRWSAQLLQKEMSGNEVVTVLINIGISAIVR